VGELVVGDSINFSGGKNSISKDIDVFVSKLKENFDLPVHMQKEFLSSVEARRGENLKTAILQTGAHSRVKKPIGEKVDAKAAAIILQRYLDRRSR
jgi:putative transcription antitermination factor YqgF